MESTPEEEHCGIILSPAGVQHKSLTWTVKFLVCLKHFALFLLLRRGLETPPRPLRPLQDTFHLTGLLLTGVLCLSIYQILHLR